MDQARSWIGTYLGETTEKAVARLGAVHVFSLISQHGSGLLAESDFLVNDRPGVWRTRATAWVRQSSDDVSYLIDLELHAWDAATDASATGDRRWLDGPARAMYAERDRRTKEVSDELDHAQLSVVPAGAVPMFMAGLGVDQARELASTHVPGLLATSSGT